MLVRTRQEHVRVTYQRLKDRCHSFITRINLTAAVAIFVQLASPEASRLDPYFCKYLWGKSGDSKNNLRGN